ncbi:MAG: hypothetical protein VW930_07065, partial [Burkholderiaceae bacterium]
IEKIFHYCFLIWFGKEDTLNQTRFEYQLYSKCGVSLNSKLKSIKLAYLTRYSTEYSRSEANSLISD